MTAAGRQHGQKKEGKRERQAEQSPLSLSLPQPMDGHLYLGYSPPLSPIPVLRATVVIFKLALVPFRRTNERRYRPF